MAEIYENKARAGKDKNIPFWEREMEIKHQKHLEKSFTEFLNKMADVKLQEGSSLTEVSDKPYINASNLYKKRESRNIIEKSINLGKGDNVETYRVKTLDVREYFSAPKGVRGLNTEIDYDTRVISAMNNKTQDVSALKMKGYSRLGFSQTDEVAFINASNETKDFSETVIKLGDKVEIRDMNALRFAMEKVTEGKQKQEVTAFFKNFVTENEAQYKRYAMKSMANKAVKKLSDNLSFKKLKDAKGR